MAKDATPRVFRKSAELEEKKGLGAKSGRAKSEKSAEVTEGWEVRSFRRLEG